jgi:hypothetical protein
MASIFISYTSQDREFSRKLAADLSEIGHSPWLDEWEIKVGECIVEKVEVGISKADYVVLILSPRSIQSQWVDREWRAKYWEEVEKGQVFLLPALIEACEIPSLIKTKKYADFRVDYSAGLADLTKSIPPIPTSTSEKDLDASKIKDLERLRAEISTLITKTQSSNSKLSQCISEALAIAQETNNKELDKFCRRELSGLQVQGGITPKLTNDKRGFSYRLINGFGSVNQLNPQYIGWGENVSAILEFMRSSDEFYSLKVLITFPISRVEVQQPADPRKQVMNIQFLAKQVFPDYEYPEQPVFVYFSGYEFIRLLESIRTELTRLLLSLPPLVKVNEPSQEDE